MLETEAFAKLISPKTPEDLKILMGRFNTFWKIKKADGTKRMNCENVWEIIRSSFGMKKDQNFIFF